MNNHITSEEWRAYLAGGRITPERLRLMSKIHAHMGACAECRALHDKLTSANEALRRFSPAPVAREEVAYRAVASDAPARAESGSTLSIDIENGLFLYDTLVLTGDFLRYAFEPEADSPRLTDACDPDIWMEISDGELNLHLHAFPGTRLSYTLTPESPESSPRCLLPPTRCRLLITAG